MTKECDYLIIGAGIIGMAIARAIKFHEPNATILIIDKENKEAHHASSRNSGVLHAGFYYTADSLKAKFTVDGNTALRNFCRENNLALNECGKLVVAQNEEERLQLNELFARGKKNGSNVKLITKEEAEEIEPNVVTFKQALHSPDTASVNPIEVCETLKKILESQNVTFLFETAFISQNNSTVETTKGPIAAKKVINSAGLYADKIAQQFGFGEKYTIIPFKGLYLKYTKDKTAIQTNIYPVPNLKNPFLGVHFTKTADGTIKIGPTAIPAFWRENYQGLKGFKAGEFFKITARETQLFLTNSFRFRDLAIEEMRKYNKNYFVQLAQSMVKEIDVNGFTEYTKPGIRAQLLDKRTLKLLQDFVIEGDHKSIHILNAVSPAFTCSFPFAEHVYQNYIK